ncbi:MAG: O-antigen ligase family protein [Solirubrobacterales bacterium]
MPKLTPPADLTKHATTAVVAVLVVLLSLGAGGYSAGLRSAIAVVSWAAILGGIAFGLLPRSRIPGAALVAGGMLTVLALLSAISVAWGSDAGAAVEATVLVAAYLGIFALTVLAAREGDARSWLAGLALGIALVGALAVLNRLIPGLPGGDEQIANLLPSARGRLSYPIGYWNATACLLAFGALLMIWLGATARTQAGRATAVATIPMLALGIYLASSRGAFAALLLGIVVLVGIGPRRLVLLSSIAIGGLGAGFAIAVASRRTELLNAVGPHVGSQGADVVGVTVLSMLFVAGVRLALDGTAQRLRVSPLLARVGVGALVVGCIVGAALADPSKRFDEFKSVPANQESGRSTFITSHLASGSGSGRWQFWGVAIDAFGDEPVHGIGAGGFAAYWTEHAPISRATKQAHSLYLEKLGDLGPLGLLTVVGFLVVPIAVGVRRRAAMPGGEAGVAIALGAAVALSAGIEWIFQIPVVFGVGVVVMAVLSGPSLAAPLQTFEARRSGAGSRPALKAVLTVLGCAAVLVAGDQFLAQRSLDASQSAARTGDLHEAAVRARRAIALEPWAAEPHLQLALVQESAGALPAAARSIEKAIEDAPDDWSLWLVRARIATRQGRLDEALSALARARRLNPRAPVFSLTGPLPV